MFAGSFGFVSGFFSAVKMLSSGLQRPLGICQRAVINNMVDGVLSAPGMVHINLSGEVFLLSR